MRGFNQRIPLLVLALIVIPGAAAQSTLDWPVGDYLSFRLDSGVVSGLADEHAVVYETLVTVEDAVWLRLYFATVDLAPGSYLRMTSVYDGEVQELDADGIAMWHGTSAYFNGDSVLLELVAGPDTVKNQVSLDQVAAHIDAGLRGPCADDDCGMCGADDRTPSSETWAGRLMPVGCTGSVYNTDSCVVSAGHCADGNNDDVIQFNVPDSASNCYPYNPPVADQFPITAHSFNNGGVGADWAVMTTGTNGSGQKPYDRYGEFRPISESLGSAGDTVTVWGFGVDNNQPTRSQTQQVHSGTIANRYTTRYTINVDITYGNSGSSVIRNHEIIGIVTHCPCPNTATRIDLSAFATAREQLCGDPSGYCPAQSNSTSYEYISNVSVGSINNSSGATAYSDYTAQSTDMAIGTGYTFTVTLDTTWDSDVGGLWVDWNQDEDFDDSGETITTAWSGLGPYTTTITPPAGAAPGTTRMRVRIQDGSYDPTPAACGDTSYGEVEDYSINVTAGADETPPTPNPMTFSDPPTPTATNMVSMTATLATDASSPPVEYYFDFASGGAGGDDRTWGSGRVYADIGLSPNTSYSYRVKARDSAPTPNETAYSSTATTATYIQTPTIVLTDPIDTDSIELNHLGSLTNLGVGSSGLYFDSTTSGGDTGINQWLQTTTDTAIALTANTTYAFRAKARNQNGLETAYSSSATETTLIETPVATVALNPDTDTIEVRALGTLTNLGDGSSGVYFDSTTGGGDGGINQWIQGTVDYATGLDPNTEYTFRVKARNQDAVETSYASSATVATLANVPAAPSLSAPSYYTMDLNVNPNGNPSATQFAIRCTASADSTWDGRYVAADGSPVAGAVWRTDSAWATIMLVDMQPSTQYTFAVKARNLDDVETAFGPSASLSTLGVPTGACCFEDGSCDMRTEAHCIAAGGDWQGDDSDCDPNPCSQPVGACCFYDGTCDESTEDDCMSMGGEYQGDGTDCNPNPCLQPEGACCFDDGHCEYLTEDDCMSAGGDWLGMETGCDPNPCDQPIGACCFEDGACQELIEAACTAAGGEWRGMDTGCVPNLCDQPIGACCFEDGTCQELTEAACMSAGGDWQGMGTGCDPNLCDQPVGACCFEDGTCQELTEAACMSAGGDWQGMETGCDPNLCPSPGCQGDFNCDGVRSFDDIDYLVAALGGEEAWAQFYRDNNGGEDPPCNYADNCIPKGYGEQTTFEDIDPFIALLGVECPGM